jgi:hypothetical protein
LDLFDIWTLEEEIDTLYRTVGNKVPIHALQHFARLKISASAVAWCRPVCWTLEEEIDTLYRNVGNKVPIQALQSSARSKTSAAAVALCRPVIRLSL